MLPGDTNNNSMTAIIKINAGSNQPKYQQLVQTIIDNIEKGIIRRGEQLPSINEMADEQGLSKATVAKSYEALREKGIIIAQHGKGFYVSSTEVRNSMNIFVLFDTLNAYKEVLYNSMKDALPADARLNIFFHHYNIDLFKSLIWNNLGNFSNYVVMPHFDQDVSAILKEIPKEKLLIIDKDVPGLDKTYSAVFQDFEQDVYSALSGEVKNIRKYVQLVIVRGVSHFQYIPAGILKGVRRFGRNTGIKIVIKDELDAADIRKGDAYLLFSDNDLMTFLKATASKRFVPGKDVGLISYDDTPLKEFLLSGVSVITTDFEEMGKTAAAMLLGRSSGKRPNPGRFIRRSTL